MTRLAPRLAALALLAILAAPASAQATDFCVAPNTTCGGTNVATLPAALAAADNAANVDRVFLGEATYTAPTTAGFDYNAPTFPIEIVGAGTNKTNLTAPVGASRVLRLQGGPGSSIHDLAVALPQWLALNAIGLDLADPGLRLTMTAHPAQTNNHTGIVMRDGAGIAEATITLSQDIGPLIGIVVAAPSASIARSTIVARTGVSVSTGTSATIDRVTATSSSAAVAAIGGSVTVTSSVLHPVDGGSGLVALDQPGNPGFASADGVTIVGDDSGGSAGVVAGEFQGGASTLTMENSVVRGVENALRRYGGTGTASLTAMFSDFDPSTSTEDGSAGILTPPVGALDPGGNMNVDPQFVNPASDFHLFADSPLVDAGDPAAPGGLDFDGNPLLADGNGDGIVRRDIGAFEGPVPRPVPPPSEPGGGDPVPPPPAQDLAAPALSKLGVRPARVRSGRAARLDVTLDEPATLRVELQRAVAGRRQKRACRPPSRRNRHGKRCIRHVRVALVTSALAAGARSVRLPGRALRLGRYRVVVTATDAAGNRSAAKTATFAVRRR